MQQKVLIWFFCGKNSFLLQTERAMIKELMGFKNIKKFTPEYWVDDAWSYRLVMKNAMVFQPG